MRQEIDALKVCLCLVFDLQILSDGIVDERLEGCRSEIVDERHGGAVVVILLTKDTGAAVVTLLTRDTGAACW